MKQCQDCLMLEDECVCSKKKPKKLCYQKYKVTGVKLKINERKLEIVPPYLEEENDE